MNPQEEIAALAEHSRRVAGSDAERRAARHLGNRLRALGREVDVEPIRIRPRAALAHAIHASLAIAGSLVSVADPAAGAALVLLATVLAALDLMGVLRLTRAVTGRRASQNVSSPEGGEKAGVVLVVAHYDSGRDAGGLARLTRFVRDPWALLLGSMLLLLGCCVLRVIGAEAPALAVAQFVPTVALVGMTAVLVQAELAGPAAGGDGNASGVVTALRLAEQLGGRLEQLDLWVLLTGAGRPFPLGMSEWLRRHRTTVRTRPVLVIALHDVHAGKLVFARRHGPVVPFRADAGLLRLCTAMREDGAEARPGVVREPVDAAAATARGIGAITLTGDGGEPERDGLERAFAFCRELITRVDAELGPAPPQS